MLILPLLLLSFDPSAIRRAPAGTEVHIRLTTTLGSYASRAGTPIGAVVIAPVKKNGETVLPAGSVVSGRVKGPCAWGLAYPTKPLQSTWNSTRWPCRGP